MSIFHYTGLIPFLVLRVCNPSPLQSTTGAQFNVAAVTGHWQLVLGLIDAGIEPVSSTIYLQLKPDAFATRPRTKSFFMALYIL